MTVDLYKSPTYFILIYFNIYYYYFANSNEIFSHLSPIRMRKKYTRVNILRCVNIFRCANQPVSKFNFDDCVRMGFITRSIFVCKFIISGLKPVHLSFLHLQNKKRLLQGVLVVWQRKRIV